MKRLVTLGILVLLSLVAGQTTAHGGILKEIGSAFEKEGKKAGKTIKKTANKIGGAIEKEAKKFGNTLKKTLPKVDIAKAKRMLGDLPSLTTGAWQTVNPKVLEQLARAIKDKNGKEAARILTGLVRDNPAMRKMVLRAKQLKMRSLTIEAGWDASYGVTGAGCVGIAYDVDALADLIRNGGLPRGRLVATIYSGGGVAIGASAGASVDLAFGFSVDSPDDMGGLSLDVNVEVQAAAGGNSAFSFKPNLSFESFALGISAGVNLRVSGGISTSGVLAEIRN
jgi:hypothetical protein